MDAPALPLPEPEIAPEVHARRWAILAVLCLSLMIVIIGNTSLNVAIPTLAAELDASTSQLQWMVDAYALVFAGLLFSAGTLGDRFGRKGALQVGLALFLVGSVLAAMAPTAMRAIQPPSVNLRKVTETRMKKHRTRDTPLMMSGRPRLLRRFRAPCGIVISARCSTKRNRSTRW